MKKERRLRTRRSGSPAETSSFALDEDILQASRLEKLAKVPERRASDHANELSMDSIVGDFGNMDHVVTELSKWTGNGNENFNKDLSLTLAVSGMATALAVFNKFDPKKYLEAMGIDCSALEEYTGITANMAESTIIATLISTMNEYSYVTHVQTVGLDALENLSGKDSGTAKLVYKQGGIKTVLTAMKMNRDDAAMQRSACLTLCHLAKLGKHAQLDILKENGLVHVAKVAQDHLEVPATRAAASTALKLISAVLDTYGD